MDQHRPEEHSGHGGYSGRSGHGTEPAPAAPEDHSSHSGHDRHSGHSVAMFRDKFWLSLALTISVVFWSQDPQKWLGYAAPAFPGSELIPPILGTLVFLYGGLVFIRGAVGELRGRQPAMILIAIPIAAGILVPWGLDLPMAVGAIAMSASTIIVAANAQLLRRVSLRPRDAVA